MRVLLLTAAALLAAAPAFAAGHSSGAASGAASGSASGKASNRYQASWTLAVPHDSRTGETEVMFQGADRAAPEAHDEPAGHGAPPPAATGSANRIVEIPTVVAPLVVGGRLVNYAFVTVQLDIAPGHDPYKVADETAYLRDAMLRAAHRQPLNPEGDPGHIDPERASRVWTAAANEVLGEGVVGAIHIVAADMRYPDLAGGR